MKTILRISALSLWAALIGSWPADAAAQAGARGPCGFPLALPGGAVARAATMRQTVLCLKATGQAPATGAPAGGGSFVTVDPPGSLWTTPTGITPDGTITGFYCNTAACAQHFGSAFGHGFLRTPGGGFTTLDVPGSSTTNITSIAPSGEIAGVYCDTACSRYHGFVRASNGTITTFDAPGSASSLFSSIYTLGPPPSINPGGAIAGTCFDASGNEHGFLRAKNGAWTTIDVPGAGFTTGLAINPSGAIVGDFCGQIACYTGYIRFPDGSFATIPNPSGCGSSAIAINPAGTVAGAVSDTTCSVVRGYVRFPTGAITIFDAPQPFTYPYTVPLAINSAGTITGQGGNNTFVRTPDGTITTFGVPGSYLTDPTAINPAGAIVGVYYDANIVQHGYLLLP
jgi:hypothetical protein